MTQAAVPEIPEGGRRLAFSEIAADVSLVEVGDTIDVPDFEAVDGLAVALVNMAVSPEFGGTLMRRWHERMDAQLDPTYAMRTAVREQSRLTHKGVEVYSGWPTDKALPSETLRPNKRHHGKMLNTTVTLLDRSEQLLPPDDTKVRAIDLLFTADPHSTGRGIIGHEVVKLAVKRIGGARSRIRYTKLRGSTATEAFAAIQAESRGIARIIAIQGISMAVSAGAGSLGKRS